MTTYFTIDAIKRANKDRGLHFFDDATMRFFRSRVSGPVIGNMFVTSERVPSGAKRRYTIRTCQDGMIQTVGEAYAYASKATALREIRRIASGQNRCVYCGVVVADESVGDTPESWEDARWDELAKEHESWCEWVRTRAHRIGVGQ